MTDPQPSVVELLARGYTREQIAAWQAAVCAPEPEKPETKRVQSRRKT